ncbi:MAG: IS3 family transposase [Anaerobutyricum hallii]
MRKKTGRNRDIFLKKLKELERGEAEPDTPGTYLSGNQERTRKYNYPILLLCEIGGISRSSYYKWLHHAETPNERFNEELAEKLERLHEKHPDMGYRRLNDKLRHDEDIQVNDKRILRICRKKQILFNLKSRYNGCTRASNNPAFIAENILNI